MVIYSKDEQEQFDREIKERLKEIEKENQERFYEVLDSNNSTTQMKETAYIEKMKRDYLEHVKRKRLGKRHTAYSPEYGFEEI